MVLQKSWDQNNFKQSLVFIPDLEQFEGKSFQEVLDFVTRTYSKEYHLAGASYGIWSGDFAEKTGYDFKTGLRYYFFGSNLSKAGARPTIPYRYWENSDWLNGVNKLTDVWSLNDRAVLLKENSSNIVH